MIPKPESHTVQLWRAAIGIAAMLVCASAIAQVEEAEAPPGDSAIVVVEQLLEGFVEAAQLSDLDARVEFLRDIILTSHDLDFIGQLTVRRQWRDWTEEQRTAFLEAFKAFSVMNYAARFGNVSEDSFDVLGQEPAGRSRVQVSTTIARADGTPVPLDFVLQTADDDGWRIANVIADGVSDLALKRAEYTTILSESGFEGLLAELEAQTRELAESAGD